ncbi:hypothetical protein G3485_11830 [Shewanella baltica]|uniref:hypothetical protein n=1 Tax=Shewanella baltica TaxID=62322 RepID=UPI00217CCE87|nr:hypothetical protein [Shewanella baltica]MCS6127676.1 hypothetical protein [Shewanella baltica]MCS6139749.1 hypothetical protein [Shewanella baltica]MCS6145890.1 hypothetical protein [Shewanella baltica]MCS6170466.1 hypothetical protein [Shewanella baltica]MCS6187690.1 hypothetical protein [Shewanella baltica]
MRCLHILWLALMLNACVAPLLLMSPQGQLMWALLKPLVGLDPNDVGLFEQPLIKNRMQELLGKNYDTTVSLLKTADKIQQEGPLIYLVSTYTPVPEMAEKAGLVWNSDTNQMAVMLMKGGAPSVISEQFSNQTEKLVPSWPKELADYTDPQKLQQKALDAGANQVQQQLAVPNAVKAVATGDVNAVQSAVTENAVLPARITDAAVKVATPSMPAMPAEIKSLPVVPEVKKQ